MVVNPHFADALRRVGAVGREVVGALAPRRLRGRFRGAYSSYEQALGDVRPGILAGYDHSVNVDVCLEDMCQVNPWDYPVLYWLFRLSEEVNCLVDAGGHIGTKYRAFRRHLPAIARIRWVVYDLPAMVRIGRQRALTEGLSALSFLEQMSEAPPAELLLASGLLQYLDRPFPDLVRELPTPPRHLLLNKVATRDGPTIVTLENLGAAETPYQIRNRDEFERSLHALGYVIHDEWTIPSLSHTFPSHSRLGSSTSRGYYATLSGS